MHMERPGSRRTIQISEFVDDGSADDARFRHDLQRVVGDFVGLEAEQLRHTALRAKREENQVKTATRH
jgi:hypothetical protein